MSDSESSSMGCIAKGLIGLAITAVVVVIGTVLIGRYVLLHTAVPAKGVVALLNKAPGVQIDGVEGSASSGFTVNSMRFTDDDGNENALDDARLKYEQKGDAFIITDLHVGRGHFYFDSTKETTSTSSASSNDISTASHDSTTSSESADFQVIIEKASINDVTVEDVGTGKVFHLKGIQLEDLELGKNNDLGKFIVESTNCAISILPSESPIPGKIFTLNARFDADFHEELLATIDIKGTGDFTDPHNADLNLTALGDTIKIRNEGEQISIQVKNLSLQDYFKTAPPISQLNLNVSGTGKEAKAKGSFLFKNKKFDIAQNWSEAKDGNDAPLIATYEAKGTAYTIAIPSGGNFMDLQLTTKPELSLADAVSKLLTNKKHSALDKAEKSQVDRLMKHFEKTAQ